MTSAAEGLLRPAPANGRRGFVLIAVLAALLIAAIWATSASERIDKAVSDSRSFDLNGRSALRAQDALAAAAYLIATSPASVCGLQPGASFIADEFINPSPDFDAPCVKLDGSDVELAGQRVQLQDAGGLISVRLVNRDLINSVVVSDVAGIATLDLSETLADYGDLDDDPYAGGAEAPAYREAGRTPPRNLWPRTPYEAFDALGWNRYLTPEVADRLSIALQVPLNLNTADAGLIAQIAPFDAADADAIIKARQRFGISTNEELAQATGGRLPVNPFAVSLIASTTTRIRVYPKESPNMIEASITRSAVGNLPPWSLDYLLTAPQRNWNEERNKAGASVSAVGSGRN